MRFLLKAGKHRQGKCRLWDTTGKETRPDSIHQYDALDPDNCIIEDSQGVDLVERFGAEKFERLPDTNGKAKSK